MSEDPKDGLGEAFGLAIYMFPSQYTHAATHRQRAVRNQIDWDTCIALHKRASQAFHDENMKVELLEIPTQNRNRIMK